MKFEKAFIAIILIVTIAFTTTTYTPTYSTISQKNLGINSYQTIPSYLQPEQQNVILQMNLTHSGTTTYQDIVVKASFPEIFETVNDTVTISKMNPSDIFTITMKFNVLNPEAGVYSVPINLVYEDAAGNSVRDTKYINLQVLSESELELTGIKGEVPYVGNEFEKKFIFENKGYVQAGDVQAIIWLNSSIVSWLPSSKIIRAMLPGEETEVSFNGIVSENAVPGAYRGTLTLQYVGGTIVNDFVLDIYGKPDLQIAGILTDEEPNPTKKVSLSVQLENIGKGDAKSTKVTMIPENEKHISGVLSSYIGTIDYDDTDSAIFDVIFKKTGLNEIPVLVEYTDESGKPYSLETTIKVYNYNAPISSITYIIAFVVAGGILYYVYWKRKKHKKEGKMTF